MKLLLLDADGVVLQKGEYFSSKFSREHGVPLEKVLEFFKGPFGACQAGTADLKEALPPYLNDWNWQGNVDEFLEYWFTDVKIEPAIKSVIDQYRHERIRCYMASNNEHYRARKIEEELGDLLDGYFFSADLKFKKENPEYFKIILEKLGTPATETAFVDNEEKNIEAARAVGIDARLYTEKIFSELLHEDVLQEFKPKLQ